VFLSKGLSYLMRGITQPRKCKMGCSKYRFLKYTPL